MPEKDSGSLPVGICQRLFSFIVRSLVGPRLQRKSLELSVRPPGLTQMPAGDEPVRTPGDYHMSPGGDQRVHHQTKEDPTFDIEVRFKQTEDLEYWTPVDNLGSSVHVEEIKDLPGEISIKEISRGKVAFEAKGPQESTQRREKGTKKTVTIRQVSEDERKKKGKEVMASDDHQSSAGAVEPVNIHRRPSRHLRPLLSVASNINEKADSFIRSRKEAMRRNISLGAKKA